MGAGAGTGSARAAALELELFSSILCNLLDFPGDDLLQGGCCGGAGGRTQYRQTYRDDRLNERGFRMSMSRHPIGVLRCFRREGKQNSRRKAERGRKGRKDTLP
eukprot:Cvel_36336.t1-p1 / transcript=Cvel_36336.t1 / gene=Cvel_36336 / organism=Chromera_velia_CCMP2878 / gene_product=hypothetical protein / transcript_product=hypothetical protein / location=Cvel_scaffold7144:318-628(-) / protein_length=103 / sequence_SO=supercontig / SO=protein_coding / is_pseudo=false